MRRWVRWVALGLLLLAFLVLGVIIVPPLLSRDIERIRTYWEERF